MYQCFAYGDGTGALDSHLPQFLRFVSGAFYLHMSGKSRTHWLSAKRKLLTLVSRKVQRVELACFLGLILDRPVLRSQGARCPSR